MAVKTDTQPTTLPAQEREPREAIDSSSRGDIPLRWVTSILLLVFPTATLFVDRGDSYVLGLLTLIGIWVWLRDGARRWLDRPAAVLWIAFALFFTVALLSYLLGTQTDAGFRFLGRYLRFLLIAPVYLALRRYPPTANTVFIGLALGALLAGVLGGLHFLHAEGAIRVEATTGLSIIFGDLTATMTLCTVAAFVLFDMSRRNWTTSLLVLCVAGGIAAMLLAGTRGAWIPLLLLPLILITSAGGFLKRRYAYAVILVLVAVFSSLYFVGRLEIRERIGDVARNLRGYAISLHAATAANGNGFAYPHCVSNDAFLHAWLRDSYLSTALTSDAAIVQADRTGAIPGCSTSDAVYLYNRSKTEVAHAAFPRVPINLSQLQRSEVLLRGKGAITFDGVQKAEVNFDTQKFRRIALQSTDLRGIAIYVFIPPQGRVWLAPMDGYFGEYSMSLVKNPVGTRLEMWRAAWRLFLRRPLLGVGTGAYQPSTDGLIAAGKIAPVAADYDHPHNDYLNALASSGVVGFLVLLAILIVPLARFWRALRGKDSVSHAVGLAGALTVLGFAIYALTDTIFLHSMMITWYAVYMALFYALLDVQATKLAKPPLPTP